VYQKEKDTYVDLKKKYDHGMERETGQIAANI
jgi:hypothetical protein